MIRILLVEDDKVQLELMAEVLQNSFPDYEILMASTMKEAMDVIEKLRVFSLVITDYSLAQTDEETGYQLLEYCQKHLSNVPVIIITAYGRDSEKEVRAGLSFQKGAFDFMHKPLDPSELIERIKRALTLLHELA